MRIGGGSNTCRLRADVIFLVLLWCTGRGSSKSVYTGRWTLHPAVRQNLNSSSRRVSGPKRNIRMGVGSAPCRFCASVDCLVLLRCTGRRLKSVYTGRWTLHPERSPKFKHDMFQLRSGTSVWLSDPRHARSCNCRRHASVYAGKRPALKLGAAPKADAGLGSKPDTLVVFISKHPARVVFDFRSFLVLGPGEFCGSPRKKLGPFASFRSEAGTSVNRAQGSFRFPFIFSLSPGEGFWPATVSHGAGHR